MEVIITTTHPIAAYGGIQIGENVLEEMATALKAGGLPMVAHHDLRRPMDAAVLAVSVRDRADGFKELWALLRVDADQWAMVEKERVAAGLREASHSRQLNLLKS